MPSISASVTFTVRSGKIPLERRRSHCYRGFNLAWLRGSNPDALSVIDFFDPETLRFKLKQPRTMKAGDRFEVFAPSANWNIHDNTITGCRQSVVIDAHGSDTSLLRNNLIERGSATNATHAIQVRGHFRLIDNNIAGFDEKEVPSK